MATRLTAGAGALSDYYDWFTTAAHGAVLIYHQGDLSYDRDPDLSGPGGEVRAKALGSLASRVFNDARMRGLVLSQRRIAESEYEYRATRLRQPAEASYEVPVRHGAYQPA